MSFNILKTIINNLSTHAYNGYNGNLANAENDMALAICAPLRLNPTQYHGPQNCYSLLNHLCNQASSEIQSSGYATQAIINNLVDVADRCHAWFYPSASAVYYCKPVDVMVSTTTYVKNVTETTSTNYVNINQVGNVVNGVSDNLAEVVYEVVDNHITLRFAGNPIVPSAPTTNAELYQAIQKCNNMTDTAIYKTGDTCSDNSATFNSAAYKALCMGALLSTTPVWMDDSLLS